MGRRERQRTREREALRRRGWAPILPPSYQRRADAAVAAIEAEGYTVEFVEWCESAESPGIILGMMAGVTLAHLHKVKVRTPGHAPAQVVAILEHELEHVRGVEWATDHEHLGLRCGGRRNGFGDPIGSPRPVDHSTKGQ